jgi:hypothetical protein
MRGFLAGLRSLVLGDTWVLPISVACAVGAAVVLKAIAPGVWDDTGGPLLLLGALLCLVAATRSSG